MKMTIDCTNRKSVIAPEIYGSFAEHLGRCIYEGLYVGENSEIPNKNGMRTDVVEALKELKLPVLRWPGGCFADEYHWRDGIGPKEKRPPMINTHWGGVSDDNSFGTHEFLELCEQLGCEPYITGNLGSGTVEEMSKWIEYMTAEGDSEMTRLRKQNGREAPWKIKYFGVGNENWGCGGNMTAEFYAHQYRRYATYCRNYPGNQLYKVACGPYDDLYSWTEALMPLVKDRCDAISLHCYTWCKSRAREVSAEQYEELMKRARIIGKFIDGHLDIMNRYDPEHKVKLIVDEWGTWYHKELGSVDGFLYQQSTMSDALVAAISFDIFNARCDRISMANIAQTANVLQSVVLTEGERMVKTPTFYAFKLYIGHMGSTLLGSFSENENENISHTASVNENGEVFLTISNASLDRSYEFDATVVGHEVKTVKAEIITADRLAYNDFDKPEQVNIKPFDGVKAVHGGLRFTLPPCSVVSVKF